MPHLRGMTGMVRRWRGSALTAATIAIFVAPVLGLGMWVRGAVASDVAARSANDRVASATLASHLVADDLAAAGESLRFLAQQPDVRQWLHVGDLAALGAELARFQSAWPGYMS